MAETPQLEKWEQDLCYSTPAYKEHKVNGKIQKFYPVTPAHLFRLRRLGSEAAKAISHITSDRSRDSKTTQQTARIGDTGIESVIQTEAVSLQLVEYRDKQRADAWSNIFTTATDAETLNIFAGVIMESLRDVFGTLDFPLEGRPSEEKFVAKTQLPTMAQMIVGVAKGNKDVLGPLGDRVFSFLAGLEENLYSRVNTLSQAASKAAPDSTTGSSFKTPSPSLPDAPATDTEKLAT